MGHSIGRTTILLGVGIAASWAQLPALAEERRVQAVRRSCRFRAITPVGLSHHATICLAARPCHYQQLYTGGRQLCGQRSGQNLPPGPIRLTLADAVKFGLSANLGPISANDSARAARAERMQALSALLPNISANASDTVTQVNLAAYGFQFNVPASRLLYS